MLTDAGIKCPAMQCRTSPFHHQNKMEECSCPEDFRCPISMELMKDPVTISTGVTYDRRNIHRWFFTYRKNTCPATMQPITDFEMTPNHTLRRLISMWLDSRSGAPPPPTSAKHGELAEILATIETTPFKVRMLRKLRNILEIGNSLIREDFKRLGGAEAIVKIMAQILQEGSDFDKFRACEEALGVLNLIPISGEDDPVLPVLMSPNCTESMAAMLQRGSADARLWVISTFQRIRKWNCAVQDQGSGFYKSLLEVFSDEVCSRAGGAALQLLIELLAASKKARLKAIEAGAVCTLVELLPDSGRARCERVLTAMKLLCECAEGRLALAEHGLGISAVARRITDVSPGATRAAVKIVWLVASLHPTERVLEEILACGAVERLVVVLHAGGIGVDGMLTTKNRAVKVLKMHDRTWRRHPCFPGNVREYLGLRD